MKISKKVLVPMSMSIVLLLSSVYQTEKPLLSRTSDKYLKQ